MNRKLVISAVLASLALALPASAASSSSNSSSSSSSSSNNNSSKSSESHSSRSLSQDDAREALRAGKVMPLTAILEIVNKRAPEASGVVLDVELETEDGVLTYKINLLTDAGQKMQVRLNARTGELIAVLKYAR